jgi:hypothetical protein
VRPPGPVGVTMLLAFATVGVIEFRTVLSMLGIEVATRLYYPVAALLVLGVVAALLLLPDGEKPTPSNEGGATEGKASEA